MGSAVKLNMGQPKDTDKEYLELHVLDGHVDGHDGHDVKADVEESIVEKNTSVGGGIMSRFFNHCFFSYVNKDHFYAQIAIEWMLLKRFSKYFPIIIIIQWLHSSCSNLAYYYHERGDILPVDLGFKLLGDPIEGIKPLAEILMFFCTTVGVMIVVIYPILKPPIDKKNIIERNHFGIIVLYRYFLIVSIGLMLRSISFLSTILPAPASHCVMSNPDYNPPTTALELIFRLDFIYGCGDLLFSGHTLFTASVACVVTKYYKYWKPLLIKFIIWFCVIFLAFVIIQSHKHYTVDVWIGLYTTILVFYCFDNWLPDPTSTQISNWMNIMENKGEKQKNTKI